MTTSRILVAFLTLGSFVAIALTLASHPAAAIDCTRAQSKIERTICQDAQARAADQKLGVAFNQLRAVLPDDQRSGLRASQIGWIRDRDNNCLFEEEDARPKCLVRQIEERRRFLEGKPEAGDAEQTIYKPVFIFHSGTKRKAQLSVQAIKLIGTDAWQTKVNAKIDELIKDAIGDAKLNNHSSNEDGLYYVGLSVSIPFASPHLASVHVVYVNITGQPHQFHYSKNFNIELPAGRELTFDDLFDPTKANELFKHYHSEIVKQKVASADIHGLGDEEAHDVNFFEVIDGVKGLSGWTFTETGAEIYYGDYSFGGYGHCMCTCVLSYAQLRAAARRDPPFP